MKIVYHNKRPTLAWDMICKGAVFEWNDRVYLCVGHKGGPPLAADLKDGTLCHITEPIEVLPLKATLNVEVL